MKKNVLKLMITGILLWWVVLTVNAYTVWNPVQYIKQIFVTPNGEKDPRKALIKMDWKTGRIDAKSVYVNWKSVVTTDYLGKIISSLKIKYPVCSKWEALTSTDWKKLQCIKVELAKIDWKCNNSVKNGCYVWTAYGGRQSWNRYYWFCGGENGWGTDTCRKYSPQKRWYKVCTVTDYKFSSVYGTYIRDRSNLRDWHWWTYCNGLGSNYDKRKVVASGKKRIIYVYTSDNVGYYWDIVKNSW